MLTEQSPTQAPGLNVEPWDLWDQPFVYETEDLDTFLLFLMDKEAKQYEISNLTAYSLTLSPKDVEAEPSLAHPAKPTGS